MSDFVVSMQYDVRFSFHATIPILLVGGRMAPGEPLLRTPPVAYMASFFFKEKSSGNWSTLDMIQL